MTAYVETAADTGFAVFIALCEAAARTAPDEWLLDQMPQRRPNKYGR